MMSIDSFSSTMFNNSSNPELGCYTPPTKRLRVQNLHGATMNLTSNNTQQGWLRLGAARRSSLVLFMEQDASPVKLDSVIGRDIFDSNPLESPPLLVDGTREKRRPQRGKQQQSSEFSPFEETTSQMAWPRPSNAPPSLGVIPSSTNAIIHATMEVHNSIEEKSDDTLSFSILSENEIVNDAEDRFRTHQAEGWMKKYEELVFYKKRNGDCLVPNQYLESPSLAEWVKRQRYQYKLRKNGQHSSMCDERIDALTSIGFCWNAHDACWSQRFAELEQYKKEHGHTNIPSSCNAYPKLAVWVKRQRRQYKFLMNGKQSTLTPKRVQKLVDLEFSWSGRKSK